VSDQKKEASAKTEAQGSTEYVTPAIETVVSKKDLEREVQYAGSQSFRPA
jgi:hypothetical protein